MDRRPGTCLRSRSSRTRRSGPDVPDQLSCGRYRGKGDGPLLLINHWIQPFPPSPTLNAPIGRAGALRRRIERCDAERGVRGAIVAADFYQQSDLVKVAEQQNRKSSDPP